MNEQSCTSCATDEVADLTEALEGETDGEEEGEVERFDVGMVVVVVVVFFKEGLEDLWYVAIKVELGEGTCFEANFCFKDFKNGVLEGGTVVVELSGGGILAEGDVVVDVAAAAAATAREVLGMSEERLARVAFIGDE